MDHAQREGGEVTGPSGGARWIPEHPNQEGICSLRKTRRGEGGGPPPWPWPQSSPRSRAASPKHTGGKTRGFPAPGIGSPAGVAGGRSSGSPRPGGVPRPGCSAPPPTLRVTTRMPPPVFRAMRTPSPVGTSGRKSSVDRPRSGGPSSGPGWDCAKRDIGPARSARVSATTGRMDGFVILRREGLRVFPLMGEAGPHRTAVGPRSVCRRATQGCAQTGSAAVRRMTQRATRDDAAPSDAASRPIGEVGRLRDSESRTQPKRLGGAPSSPAPDHPAPTLPQSTGGWGSVSS